MSNGRRAFWDDLNCDLADAAFRHDFVDASTEIATTDEERNNLEVSGRTEPATSRD